MLRSLAVLILSVACSAVAAAGFTFSNTPGPHPVGFRVTQQYDYARVYQTRISLSTARPFTGERARPIQTLVWYPASASGTPLRYRDYLATMPTETDFSLDAAEAAKRADVWIAEQVRKAAYPEAQQAAGRAMWASRGAPPASGKFPVVVYAPSHSASAAENADLCEFLASQGYLVLASPSLGPRSRAMSSDLEGLEAQAADIGFLIAHAHTLPQADTARIGVVGFSWGGLANVLAAARDDRIGALVSLDGSLRGYSEFIDGGAKAAGYVAPERVAVPLLYVGKRPLTVEALAQRDIQTTFSFMNKMRYADVYIATMYPMDHADFASDALRFRPGRDYEEYTRDEAALAHSWTARYVHRFLDAYLKQDAASLAFMNQSAAQNGVPRHMLSLDIRRATASAPTLENFVGQLHQLGVKEGPALFDRFRKSSSSFSIDATFLNRWGYELLRAGRKGDAVEIFRLATHVHPVDGNLHDSLGEAYEASGNKAQAIASYRRSLELWPDNKNAAARLAVLDPRAAP